MNREVEERIVAMYFDNEDFEKNAKSTIDTLGQLKQSLNLEDSAKGFDMFEKLGKTLNFEKAGKGLQKMKNTMSSMGNIFKKIFSIGPIDNAFRALDNFKNRYFDRVLGFDIADKLVNSLESAFRNLTIAPISAGWNQYESQMDSVKTIMSSTGKGIDEVSAKLNEMTEYANKTIYSLTDMTSNLGKFTNNGIELEDSVQAMEGIANATADAGQGAQQASMAMYNISQAMGVGKMTTIDWKSLENANIATTKLKNTFLEMAAIHGKIQKKTAKDGSVTYMLTKDDDGKKLKKAIELNASNFREYLSKGWLDKETMLDTFKIYSGTLTENDLEAMGIKDEATKKYFMELGQQALEAATQVRTFSKMMDALKESAQSGWSKSFELIFGNMEEGTTLWTGINDRLDKILSSSAEKRNKILEEWRQIDENGNKIGKDDHGNQLKTVKNGRDIMIDSLFELMDVLQNLSKVFSDSFEKVFGKFDAKSLMKITVGFRDFVNTVKNWIGTSDDANSRFSKFQKGMTGVYAIFKVVLKAFKAGYDLIKRIASPIVDYLINAFGRLGEFFADIGDMKPEEILEKLGDGIQRVWDKVKKFFMPKEILDESGKRTGKKEIPAITWIKDVWQGLKNTLRKWAEDNGLGDVYANVTSWWNGFKESIDAAFASIKEWWQGSGISKFFNGIWDTINELFSPKLSGVTYDGTGRHEHYDNAPIVQFFYNIGGSISKAFETVKTWWEGSGIAEFFTEMWNAIVGLFQEKTITGKQGQTWTERAPIVQFFYDIGDKISSAFVSLQEWWADSGIPEFFESIWQSIVGLFEGKTIVGKQGQTWTENAPIVQFFYDLGDNISVAFETVKSWWESSGIPGFFTEMWNAIVGLFQEKTITGKQGQTWTERTPIVQFFYDLGDKIDEAFNTVKKWWEGSGIPEFFQSMWDTISEQFKPKFIGVIDGQEVYDDAPIVSWLKGIWTGVRDVWDSIVGWEGWAAVGSFISNTWQWIIGLFGGSKDSVAGASEEAIALAQENTEQAEEVDGNIAESVSIFQSVFQTISDFVEKVLAAVNGVVIPKEVSEFLINIGDFLKGVLEAAGKILGSIGRVITGTYTAEDMGIFLTTVLSAIGTLVTSMLFKKWESNLSGSESFGKEFLEFAAGLLLISSAVSLLTIIDQDKMLAAAGIIAGLGVVLAAVLFAVAKLRDSASESKPGAVERVVTNLINKGSQIAMLAIIMKELPKIIEAVKDAKASFKQGDASLGDDILKIAEAMALLVASIGIVMAIISKIIPQGIEPVAALKTTISIAGIIAVMSVFMLAIGGIAEGVDGIFGDKSHEAVIEAMGKAAEFMQSVGNALGSFIIGLLGIKSDVGKTQDALQIAELLGDASKSFDMEKISGISRMMTLITRLSDNTIRVDTSKMSEFGTAMGNIGEGIYTIAGYISEIEGPLSEMHNPESIQTQKMYGVLDFISRLGESIGSVGGYSMDTALARIGELAKEGNLKKFVANINTILAGLGDLKDPNGGIQFDGLTIVGKLFDAIQEGLNSDDLPMFDATSIIDAICLALTMGDMAIAQLVHDMVQNGIELATGLKDTSSEIPEWLINGASGLDTSNPLGNLFGNVNITDVENTVAGLTTALTGSDGNGGLLASMTQFKDNMPDLTSAFTENGWDSLVSFEDGTGQQVSLLDELQGKITSLSTTINEMGGVKVTITPVFDMTQFTPEVLQQALNNAPIPMSFGMNAAGASIDFSNMRSELGLDEIRAVLEKMTNAINDWGYRNESVTYNLGYHMDGIANEVSRMKLYLDTGVLCGALTPMIDQALMDRAMVFSRT